MGGNHTGKAIQQLRERRGLTQAALAEKIGVSQQSVAKWEAGDALPRTKVILTLEKELDAPAGYLLEMRSADKDESPPAVQPSVFSKTHRDTYESFAPIRSDERPSVYARGIRQQIADLLPDGYAEWDAVIRGNTTSWAVDYQDRHHVAQFVSVVSDSMLRHAFLTSIPARLWKLATLRAYLKDSRLYVLFVTLPYGVGREANAQQLFHRLTAEAALMDIFIFEVNTPQQAVAVLYSKFSLNNHQDADDEDIDLED